MKRCPTCKKSMEGRVGQAKFCSRLCYRRSPGVKERYAERTRTYQNAHAREVERRYSKLKYKCVHAKLDFNLKSTSYLALVNSPCHYCGSSLLQETGAGLDRIDPKLGYVGSNVLPCCGKCNQIRNVHLTVDEMRVAMSAVLAFRMGQK